MFDWEMNHDTKGGEGEGGVILPTRFHRGTAGFRTTYMASTQDMLRRAMPKCSRKPRSSPYHCIICNSLSNASFELITSISAILKKTLYSISLVFLRRLKIIHTTQFHWQMSIACFYELCWVKTRLLWCYRGVHYVIEAAQFGAQNQEIRSIERSMSR